MSLLKYTPPGERNRFALCVLFALFVHPLFAKEPVPLIHAHSKSVNIRDGDDLAKGIWNISPEVKPDVYYAERFKGQKSVTFYTDCDSVSFITTPGKTYDFIIVLNKKDTAYTQLSTIAPPLLFYEKQGVVRTVGSDTIPFTLGWNNAIKFRGRINGSDYLNMIFDTGANGVVLSSNALSKIRNLKIDGSMQGFGLGGASVDSVSKKNKLEIEGLVWHNINLLVKYAGKPHADVVVGYNVFDGKTVEIDYENRWLIIHTELPQKATHYARHLLKFKGGLSYIKLVLDDGKKKVAGWFDFDTGASGTLFLTGTFAAENGGYGHLKKLGTDALKGSGPALVAVTNAVLPRLLVGPFAFANVPMAVEQTNAAAGTPFNIVGNDLLKRFNCIIDYRNDAVYLQPNRLKNAWYLHQKIQCIKWSGSVGLLLLVAVAGMGFLKRWTAKKHRSAS